MSLTDLVGKGPVRWAALAALVSVLIGALGGGWAASAFATGIETRASQRADDMVAKVRAERAEVLRHYVTREELAEKVLPMRLDVAEIKALLREGRRGR